MTKTEKDKQAELASVRDTVESIWVAIVLAFVLRAFLIEAFVIPTGSMAPGLMGEHWSLQCPGCGYEYAYGLTDASAMGRRAAADKPAGAECPNCGLPYQYGGDAVRRQAGDRVLVMKPIYQLGDPRPWDVLVFRNPQNNRENYIKRLVGLPGETIEIVHGDIFVASDPNGPFRIRRKPPKAQRAMWSPIFLVDYQPDESLLSGAGVEVRTWRAADSAWDLGADFGRTFAFAGAPEEKALIFEAPREAFLPHYGYNPPGDNSGENGINNICTDLKLAATLIPGRGESTIALELSSYDDRFRAEISTAGAVRLLHRRGGDAGGDWEVWGETSVEAMSPGWGRTVALCHVDHRAVVQVGGEEVLASTPEEYPADYGRIKARAGRRIDAPRVRIRAAGDACRLRHVQLLRDVFYTQQELTDVPGGPLGDYARELAEGGGTAEEASRLGESAGWATTGHPITLKDYPGRHDLDEFFVMGDNSPRSLDGRSWTSAAPTLRLKAPRGRPQYQLGTVPRYNMTGKALFVYWPSGFRLPGLPNLPVIPNVGQMRLIR